jgi:Holliday junction resolvasome RuvABC endonuclease subunit
MIVVGLDPGTHTGWAVCRDGRIVASGTLDLSPWAARGYGAMFGAFRLWLGRLRREQLHEDYDGTYVLNKSHRLAAIAYELPFHRGAITSRITGGLAAHVLERAAAWRCKALPVQTMTLKKFATGSGKAGKDQMINRAREVLLPGESAEFISARGLLDEHEADAIHVARWGWGQLKGGER